MEKKYEITQNSIEIMDDGTRRVVHRIRALRDIPSWRVRVGDMGGYIEKEGNLTHEGDAWVKDEAQVYGDAQILGGIICDEAKAFDKAVSYSVVSGKSVLSGETIVEAGCRLSGSVRVSDSKVRRSHLNGNILINRSKVISSEITGNFSCGSNTYVSRCKIAGRVCLKKSVFATKCVFDGRGKESGNGLLIGEGMENVSIHGGYITESAHCLCIKNAFDGTEIGICRGLKGEAVIRLRLGKTFSPEEFVNSSPYDTRYKAIADLARTFSVGWRNIDNKIIEEEGLRELPSSSVEETEEDNEQNLFA